MQVYDLDARYDSRQSFYGKAKVYITDKAKELWSYNTHVATIENGVATVLDTHSSNTLRHIKEFLLQNGFRADNKKQIEKDYIKENI